MGSNIQWDISSVPIGAQVVRAKIVLTADANNGGVFGSAIQRFRDGTTANVTSTTEAIHDQFKWLARARDTGSTQLAVSSTAGTFAYSVRSEARGSTAFGQVLILSTAGNGFLGSVSMWLAKNILGTYTGTAVAKVYSTSGTSGRYTKGTLLATSDPRLANDIDSLTITEFVFTFPTPLAVTNGQIMIAEVSFDPDPLGLERFEASGDTGFAADPDNALVFGPSMQAFAEAVYMNGVEQAFGPDKTLAEGFVFPTFVAGTQYEIGETSYSPDVVLSQFTGWVQDGLDSRGSTHRLSFGFIADLFGVDPPLAGEERRWRSADHATPQIVDGNSLFGPVLVIQYDASLAAEVTVSASIDSDLQRVRRLAAELTVEASIDGRLRPSTIGHIVRVAAPEVPVEVATAAVEAAISNAVAAAKIQASTRTITTLAATMVAQIRAATLAVRVASPGLSVEVSTAIVLAALSDATTIAEVQTALRTVAIRAAMLAVEVQEPTLVAEVRAAALDVRVETSRTGGPATEGNVASTLDISPAEVDVEVTRRDSTPFSFTLQDEDGVAINITGYTSFTLTVDPSDEPSDALSNLFQLTAAFTSPASGTIVFSPSIANHTQDPGDYFFDVEQIDGSANVRTIIKGKYTILADITQP
jgi:hypothetical protein